MTSCRGRGATRYVAKFRTKYGYFTDNGKEFVITRPIP
jgi:hypothetical protein